MPLKPRYDYISFIRSFVRLLFLLFCLSQAFFFLLLFADFAFHERGVLAGAAVLTSKRFKKEGRLLDTQLIRRMRRWLRRDGGSDAFLCTNMYVLYFLFIYLEIHLPCF